MATHVIPPFGTIDQQTNHLGLSQTQHRRQQTRQELQHDLQVFLQQSSNKNPRLRHLQHTRTSELPPVGHDVDTNSRHQTNSSSLPPISPSPYNYSSSPRTMNIGIPSYPNPLHYTHSSAPHLSSYYPPPPSTWPTLSPAYLPPPSLPNLPSVYPNPYSYYPTSAPPFAPSAVHPGYSTVPPPSFPPTTWPTSTPPYSTSTPQYPSSSMNHTTANSPSTMAPPPSSSSHNHPTKSTHYGDELRRQMEQDKLKKQQEKYERRRGVGETSPSPLSYSHPSTQSTHKQSKQNYMRELEQQIQQKKMEKERLKQVQLQEDIKKQREMQESWKPVQDSIPGRPLEQSFAGRRTRPQIQAMQQGIAIETPPQDALYKTPDNYLETMSGLRVGQSATDTFQQTGLPPMLSFLNSNSVQQNNLLSLQHQPMQSMQSMQPMQTMQASPSTQQYPSTGTKSFARGQANADSMPQWQREDALRKQKAQQETQNILRQQIAEKEAEKARKEAQRKLEEEREQQRIQREQDMLKEKYQQEMQQQKAKEEQARLENEKMKSEKESRQKEEQIRMQKAIQDAQDQAKKEKEKARQAKVGSNASGETNYQPIPRSSSPPIPTLRNKKPTEAIEETSTSNQATPIQATPLTSNEQLIDQTPQEPIPFMTPKPPLHPPPELKSKKLPNPDTQAVLRQLSEIQRDLDLENQKLQIELSRPPPDTFRQPVIKSVDTPQLPTLETLRQSHSSPLGVSMEYKKTSDFPSQVRTSRQDFVRSSHQDFTVHHRKKTGPLDSIPEPSTSPVLERQRHVIQKQEQELHLLRRVNQIPKQDSNKKSVGKHNHVTPQEETLQHFLHSNEKYDLHVESMTSSEKNDDDVFSSEKIQREMESKHVSLDTPLSRPGSSKSKIFPFFDDMSRPKSSHGLLQALGGPLGRRKSQKLSMTKKRADSAGTLNVDAIASRNEERLKALGEIESKTKEKKSKLSESNIILAFLQKEAKLNTSLQVSPSPGSELPSITSWKDMSLGRGGVQVFPT